MTDSKTDDLQALETEIRRRITGAGPIPVGQYMALCLTDPRHGYYMHRDPLGARGDFITAPEISQMFGELLGLWSMAVWKLMGEPDSVRLIELGPGRGTMMLDILRTAYALPDFRKALQVHFIEVSPMLEERQHRAISSSNSPRRGWSGTTSPAHGCSSISGHRRSTPGTTSSPRTATSSPMTVWNGRSCRCRSTTAASPSVRHRRRESSDQNRCWQG